MTANNPANQVSPTLSADNTDRLPTTFNEAVALAKTFTETEMQEEVKQKNLYFHNLAHVRGVQRRANQLFQVLKPYWQRTLPSDAPPDYLDRMEQLTDLCALAHDMVQEFMPASEMPRRRETGVSEIATVEKLIDYIKELNEKISAVDPDSPAIFKDAELALIREAIEATICLYDPTDGGIFQRDLYDRNKKLSIVSQIIALADIGALGMEGIEAQKQEGTLIFLEENPDLAPIVLKSNLKSQPPEVLEDIRQRLLKRTKFHIRFARARFTRFTREVENLPADAIPVLTEEMFKYLTEDTIKEIESTTPTADDTPLDELIEFCNFAYHVAATS